MKKLIIALIFIAPLTAQQLNLSLNDGIQFALENNPSFMLSATKVREAQLNYREAIGAALPTIENRSSSILIEKVQIIPNPFVPGETLALDFTYDYQLSWTITQPLFTGGKLWNGYQIAKSGIEMASADHQLARNDLALSVIQSYLMVLVAEQFAAVAREGYAIAKDFYATTQRIYDEGLVSKLELLQAEVQMAILEPTVTQAENGVVLGKASLRMILGLDENTTIELVDDLSYKPHQFTLRALLDEAAENRLELMQMDLRQDFGRRSLSIARSDYLPMVALSGSYTSFGNELSEFGNWDNSYTVALGLSFNLFNGGRRTAKIQKAKIAIEQIELSRTSLENGIQLEIEGAYHTLIESEKSLLSMEKAVGQAEESARLAQLQFNEGTITSLQVNQIQANLSRAKANYLQGMFNYSLARYKLFKAVGRDLVAELGVTD